MQVVFDFLLGLFCSRELFLLLASLAPAVVETARDGAQAARVLRWAAANRHLFNTFAIATAKALTDGAARVAGSPLVTAVALGRNPRETARDLRAVTGQTLARALRISRTETIGAYRRAAIERYRAHSDVLEGWVWVASLSPRTCAACLAMHGTVHSLDEPFASHPVCRCSPAPLTRTWDQLLGRPTGLRETRLVARSAVGWLDSQSRSTRLAILGPGKLRELDAGRIRLADLAQPTLHPVWGPGIRETPLRDLVAGGA